MVAVCFTRHHILCILPRFTLCIFYYHCLHLDIHAHRISAATYLTFAQRVFHWRARIASARGDYLVCLGYAVTSQVKALLIGTCTIYKNYEGLH